MIPRIVRRKIVKMQKPGGLTQYIITIPKEYAETLEKEGVNSLYIVYNRGLGAFPEAHEFTEEALLTFLKKHREFSKLFTMEEPEK